MTLTDDMDVKQVLRSTHVTTEIQHYRAEKNRAVSGLLVLMKATPHYMIADAQATAVVVSWLLTMTTDASTVWN